MEAYSQTLTYMNEVQMNNERRVKMNVRWKPLARSRGQRVDKSWCKQDKGGKDCSKRKVYSETDARTGQVGVESIAVPSNGGTEDCRSCLVKELQSTWEWWVKDMSVTLRCERSKGRCRVMMSKERDVLLDWTLRKLWRTEDREVVQTEGFCGW